MQRVMRWFLRLRKHLLRANQEKVALKCSMRTACQRKGSNLQHTLHAKQRTSVNLNLNTYHSRKFLERISAERVSTDGLTVYHCVSCTIIPTHRCMVSVHLWIVPAPAMWSINGLVVESSDMHGVSTDWLSQLTCMEYPGIG